MSNESSNLLKSLSGEIMDLWEKRALEEIKAAHFQHTLALRNSLPTYLTQLVNALSTSIDRTSARKRFDKDASTRIGKKHGRERAGSSQYTMDQMILEYHILRQVICDVLERDAKLSDVDMEVIVCSIEQAVNDAATQFSDSLRQIQEQFSKTLAHDLRTPISAAKLNAQMIIKKDNSDPFYNEKAKRIIHNMDRIDSMICDLLDVSRLRAGQSIPMEFEQFDLTSALNEIVSANCLEKEGSVILHADFECIVHWNKSGITRLFENLINNAIKYGSENDPIVVTLTQIKDKISIEVHNEGEAISAEDQETLFDPYKRAKSTEDQSGWGLGLTVVKGMAEGHNGFVRIKSEAGFGTSFILDLPRDPLAKDANYESVREAAENVRIQNLEINQNNKLM